MTVSVLKTLTLVATHLHLLLTCAAQAARCPRCIAPPHCMLPERLLNTRPSALPRDATLASTLRPAGDNTEQDGPLPTLLYACQMCVFHPSALQATTSIVTARCPRCCTLIRGSTRTRRQRASCARAHAPSQARGGGRGCTGVTCSMGCTGPASRGSSLRLAFLTPCLPSSSAHAHPPTALTSVLCVFCPYLCRHRLQLAPALPGPQIRGAGRARLPHRGKHALLDF